MKNFIWLIPLLLGLNLILGGCDDRSRQPANQATPSPSATPNATKMSDSDLEKAIRAKLESDAQLKDAKLDVDANQSTATRFNIRGIPTLLVVKDGQVKEQIVGAVDKSVIVKALDKHL